MLRLRVRTLADVRLQLDLGADAERLEALSFPQPSIIAPHIGIVSPFHRRARFPRSLAWTYGQVLAPETVAPKFFPRPLDGLLAAALLQKTSALWSSASAAALLGSDARSLAHARSSIAGKSVPAMRKGDETCLQSDM